MDFNINGKPLNSLRVVDLKVELEKRGLPKSGNKTNLVDRLTQYFIRQGQVQNETAAHPEAAAIRQDMAGGVQPPNMSLSHGLTDNDFVRDYLKLRETQFQSALSDHDAHLQASKIQPSGVQPMSGSVDQSEHATSTITTMQQQDSVKQVQEMSQVQQLQNVPQLPLPIDANQHQRMSQVSPGQHVAMNAQLKMATDSTQNKGPAQVETLQDAAQEDVDVESSYSETQYKIKDTSEAEEKTVVSAEQEVVPATPQINTATGGTEQSSLMVTSDGESEQRIAASSVSEDIDIKNMTADNVDTRTTNKVLPVEEIEKQPTSNNSESISTTNENSEAQECDEIVVSISPILPDFEEIGDEEKESAPKAKDSPPPPPDITFRKLARPTSLDPTTEDQKKKRHWGRKENKETDQEEGTNTDVVSGELLKDIVPDVKPYLEDLCKDEELDHEQETEEEENNGEELEDKADQKEEKSNIQDILPEKSPPLPSSEDPHVDNTAMKKAPKGLITNINPDRSCVIEVRNLVRPFTLIQLKELLLRTGKIKNFDNGGFWIDKIKSHAIVEYLSPDEAEETAMALDGVKWPSTNPKKLNVTFSTKKVLDKAMYDNEVPLKISSNKEYQRSSSSRDDRYDSMRKRKHSEGQDESSNSNNHESSKKRRRNNSEKEVEPEVDTSHSPKPKKHLDDLFRKTKALPCIYWLPKQQKVPKS